MNQPQHICFACNKRPAVTYRQLDGRYLCKECFSDWVVSVVDRTIRRKQLFARDDRIIVGLSGGKDSTVLLDVLYKIEQNFPSSELIAVCIDEGIAGYRDDGLPIAEMNAERLGVEFHLYSFKELFGYTLDETVARSRELQEKLPASGETKIVHHGPCSFCGVFRRKALNMVARELSGDKVATGHNLNDVTQTIMMNLLRGDSRKLMRGDLKPKKTHELFVPRVKPLQRVAERDVVLYGFYNDITFHTTECPYAVEAMRLDVRNFITDIEAKYPGTLNCIKNSMETVTKTCQKQLMKKREEEEQKRTRELNACERCSEPTNHAICRGCKMLEILFADYD